MVRRGSRDETPFYGDEVVSGPEDGACPVVFVVEDYFVDAWWFLVVLVVGAAIVGGRRGLWVDARSSSNAGGYWEVKGAVVGVVMFVGVDLGFGGEEVDG